MTPREGAVAIGSSGVIYLLLEREDATHHKFIWKCLRLHESDFGGGFDHGAGGKVLLVREEWLRDDAKELA